MDDDMDVHRTPSALSDSPRKLLQRCSRAQLEAMSSDLAARLTAPIDRVLKAANLTMADINVTEIVGGAVRIPRVHEVLKEYLGDHELGQHLNGDEAMALGAAFHAANLSTAFRVRKVLMTDVTPFPIGVRLSKYDTERTITFVPPDGVFELMRTGTLFFTL